MLVDKKETLELCYVWLCATSLAFWKQAVMLLLNANTVKMKGYDMFNTEK